MADVSLWLTGPSEWEPGTRLGVVTSIKNNLYAPLTLALWLFAPWTGSFWTSKLLLERTFTFQSRELNKYTTYFTMPNELIVVRTDVLVQRSGTFYLEARKELTIRPKAAEVPDAEFRNLACSYIKV